jgi:hypothetical protein
MRQYWLKPLGVTDPPTPMPNDWTAEHSLDHFDLRTGPAIPQKIPQMGRGDRVLFHAVIHVRLFAEGEILWRPEWKEDPVWGFRWPWVYPCRIDVWVPLIEQGLASSEVVPKRALGRIQAGGDFAKLSAEEYSRLLNALRAQPNARQRPQLGLGRSTDGLSAAEIATEPVARPPE